VRRQSKTRRGEVLHVSETVSREIVRLGEYPPLPLDVVRAWDDAVGPLVARRARPARLRGRTLIIRASTSTWMSELQMLAPTVLSKLRTLCPDRVIDELRFELGALPSRPSAPETKPPPGEPLRRCEEVPETISKAMTEVSDEDLRTTIEGAVASTLSRSSR